MRCLLISTFLLLACGGSSEPDVPGSNLEPPPECTLGEVPSDWVYPSGPYGAEVGDRFQDFELKDCDREPFRVGDVLAQNELLLFNVGAGWCEPCIEETETLDTEVFREFCGRGLGVVQALFQDERSQPASSLFCEDWRQRFGLSFPVLIDDLFETGIFFDAAETPLNLVIDRQGTIVFRDVGFPPEDFAEQLDQLLAERGL